MSVADTNTSTSDPRWEQFGRDRKAGAILATLRLCCPRELARGTWLDVGCGSGGGAAVLAGHVQHMIGVDPEAWGCWQAFSQQHANLEFRTASYRELETLLGPESVDVVICNQVYEHVDDPIALLQSIHSVLKPGAVCYFAGPNLLWPIEPHVLWPFVHWLPRRFAQRWMKRLGSSNAGKLDAWSWPYWRLTRSFRRCGFRFDVAIHQRIVGGASLDGAAWVLRAMVPLPRAVLNALAPVSPGFVFVLTKAPTAS